MKKIITFAIFATVLLYVNQANAKIRRVGYFGTPVAKTDYASLQSAQDSASAGDSILLFPGSWNARLTKKLIVLGYGYFVTGNGSNANLQNITNALSVNIDLDSTSSGSILEGIDDLDLNPTYNHSVKNITIRRCRASVSAYNQTYDNWQILQCYLTYLSYSYSGGKFINLRVDNCYIAQFYFTETTGQTGQFNNNIFDGGNFGNASFLIKNSISLYYHSNDVNCIYQNSIGTSSYPIPAINGNKNITTTEMNNNVFVGYNTQSTYSNDGRFVLKTGSPAKGAGAGGTDAGIFGGTNPYKLSGIPRIPSFYKISATTTVTSTNPYTLTFSARSNN